MMMMMMSTTIVANIYWEFYCGPSTVIKTIPGLFSFKFQHSRKYCYYCLITGEKLSFREVTLLRVTANELGLVLLLSYSPPDSLYFVIVEDTFVFKLFYSFFLLSYRITSGFCTIFRIQTILFLPFQWLYLKFYHVHVITSEVNGYLYSFPENYKPLDHCNSDHSLSHSQ